MQLELRRIFDLSSGQSTPDQVIEGIRSSAELRSANLWVLLLAILICAAGLNLNSTAVIIGAMLISPLMGPITAAGLGVAVNDFDLMRRSAMSLAIAAASSILVSAVYFVLTPLQAEGTELLARTSPNAWDALIAILGGLAGAVAATRQGQSNVIPGVAIATALMPPLCTAGYGLATGNLKFFVGAVYLFYINSICIALGTLIVCRLLRYPQTARVEPEERKRIRRLIIVVTTVSLLPSAWFAYGLVQQTLFEKNARSFVEKEIARGSSQVLQRKISFEHRTIEVLTLGKPLSQDETENLKTRLADYGLERTELRVRSGIDSLLPHKDVSVEDHRRQHAAQVRQMLREMQALFPAVTAVAAEESPLISADRTEHVMLVYIQASRRLTQDEERRIHRWLSSRTDAKVQITVR